MDVLPLFEEVEDNSPFAEWARSQDREGLIEYIVKNRLEGSVPYFRKSKAAIVKALLQTEKVEAPVQEETVSKVPPVNIVETVSFDMKAIVVPTAERERSFMLNLSPEERVIPGQCEGACYRCASELVRACYATYKMANSTV